MSATEEALHDIPPEYRDRAEALLAQPVVGFDSLRAEVDDYVDTVRQVGLMVEMLDVDAVMKLVEVVRALLAMEPTLEAEEQRLVQLAAHYLVREEDDEEVTGVLGFDDDIQIINAVCRVVGREDLVVPLPSLE